jgi:predicted DNA-binding transcriptional regulator AlpA
MHPVSMKNTDPLPDYMSIATLAAYLGCSPAEISELVSSGQLPEPAHIGDDQRWRLSDVESSPYCLSQRRPRAFVGS